MLLVRIEPKAIIFKYFKACLERIFPEKLKILEKFQSFWKFHKIHNMLLVRFEPGTFGSKPSKAGPERILGMKFLKISKIWENLDSPESKTLK